MVNNAVKQDRVSSQAVVPALISQEFAAHTPNIIEELFKIHMKNTMKSDLQAQVADPELWDILKAKFEKSSASASSYRDDAFRKSIRMNIKGMMLLPRGEKREKKKDIQRIETLVPMDSAIRSRAVPHSPHMVHSTSSLGVVCNTRITKLDWILGLDG
nr:hypothetical protein [Tanacetum cinerariifolium]